MPSSEGHNKYGYLRSVPSSHVLATMWSALTSPLTAHISIFAKQASGPPHRNCRPRLLGSAGDPGCLASCLFVPFALPCQRTGTCPRLPSSTSCCINPGPPFFYLSSYCALIKADLPLSEKEREPTHTTQPCSVVKWNIYNLVKKLRVASEVVDNVVSDFIFKKLRLGF